MKVKGKEKIKIPTYKIAKPEKYPHWVLYFKHREGSTRFKVVDGITSQREGEQINQSIQKGMVIISRKGDICPKQG